MDNLVLYLYTADSLIPYSANVNTVLSSAVLCVCLLHSCIVVMAKHISVLQHERITSPWVLVQIKI